MSIYYGHTYPGDKTKRRWQLMKDHASEVARRAKDNAERFGEGDRAHLAGLLHDLGKYGDLFQTRLLGLESGLDHWSAGACCAKQAFKDAALTLAIQGHHTGLQSGDGDTLRELTLENLKQKHPLELRLTEPEPNQTNLKKLIGRFQADGVSLPSPVKGVLNQGQSAADMLDTRMLFSALVDADYLDTEEAMRHDDVAPRPEGEALDAARALAALKIYLAELGEKSDVSAKTRTLRADLMNACRAAGETDERLWTLTAPTGSGKTLAMLLFALTRAAKLEESGHPVRRIVVVLPFLSILDQTVDEYRKVFGKAGFNVNFVLEHHSLAGVHTDTSKAGQDDGEASASREAQQFVQNWDAPIIITTSVQLLESLHANRPGACRKLHCLAHGIVLLDEVQTLPTTLALTTLKTLSRLTHKKYGTVVVMATATQPAFSTLSEKVKEAGNDGWEPREMAPRDLRLFERSKRVEPVWELEAPTLWSTVQGWIWGEPQVLCIVNMRKHALELAKALEGIDGVKHISTYLCPAHRRKILDEVRAALKNGQDVRVVATQCVEAGVDLDFPKVFRALGPLDSIAQAAGRCNRHNNLPSGELRVFLPEQLANERLYPTDSYGRAAELARVMWKEGKLDLDEPDTFRQFFARLWGLKSQGDLDKEAEIARAIQNQDYPKMAGLYRLIPDASVNIVVPYGQGKELILEAQQSGITRYWMKQAQLYTVSVFRQRDGTLPPHLEPVSLRPRGGAPPQPAPDWYLCPYAEAYDEILFGYLPDGGNADPFQF